MAEPPVRSASMVRSEVDEVQDEEDWPDQIEFDPRWEVQPRMDDEDEPGGSKRLMLLVLVGCVALVALLIWLVMGAPPAA
jgi:hypothetical protein